MNRSLSMTSSAPGMPRGVGCAPVAITTCPGRNVSSPTRTVSGSTKVAVPWRAVTPDEVNHCSMRVDAGSVNVRLKAISAGQSTATCPVMPPDAWPRARSTASAALKSTFFGSQPRSVQVPPNSRRSTAATRLPAAASAAAAVSPETPVPMTMTSKRSTAGSSCGDGILEARIPNPRCGKRPRGWDRRCVAGPPPWGMNRSEA